MRFAAGLGALLLAPLLWGRGALAEPPQRAPVADGSLDKTTVAAQGKDKAELTVKSFGRFAITVASKSGIALQLVDRAAGPGEVVGRAGKEDGRIDAFFDRGIYRVLTSGAGRTKGVGRLEVHPFAETNGPKPPLLVELKPVDTTLRDFEQRSYWLEIPAARTVALEAAGRDLADLRLWKDGTWLVDAAPALAEITPKVGRPLTVARLFTSLEPGLYLVTAYGGKPRAWAEEDGTHPFHLRFGVPRLPSAMRKRLSVGPFGYDRYLVSDADYFRMELREAKPATLDVATVTADASPFTARADAEGSIQKNTNPPVTELSIYSSGALRLVTVTAKAGEPYVLQHFRSERYRSISDPGDYWVSTVHAGHPEDDLDATGILSASTSPNVGRGALELDGKHPWARRFNLLETATIFFEVKEPGAYGVASKGVKAGFRFEPFMVTRPPSYKAPSFEAPGKVWQLEAGFWILTMEPKERGIAEVTVARAGELGVKAGSVANLPPSLPQPGLRFPSLSIPRMTSYALWLNTQPGVRAGIITRRLPIDLADPLFIAQLPGEEVTVPFRAGEPGKLTAEAEDGTGLALSVDGGAPTLSADVAAGEHRVTLRHAGAHVALYTLGLSPARLRADTPLPALPDGRLAALPSFPVLSDKKPIYLDLERQRSATFLVHASTAGLHRLESTGLLATEGRVRTRVVTSLAAAAEDGVGRNFLLQRYLGQGDYQLTVATRGRTRGHLGVALSTTPMADGGDLALGVPARVSLPSGTAIGYPFEIKAAGRYELRAIGVDRTFTCRLEDDDGWPLLPPGGRCEINRELEAGKYRLVVLPEAVDSRVVTLLSPSRPAPTFKGKGPHKLPLDLRVGHVFVEAKAGEKANAEARRPDVWEFDVPADTEVAIELTGKMQADLIRMTADRVREKAGHVPPTGGFSGQLARGHYVLEVMGVTEGTGVRYDLVVRPQALVAGLERRYTVPTRVPLAVGEEGLIELASFGTSDVRARLVDSAGRTITRNDDRPDDWNFHLAERLRPGSYSLLLDPVGTTRATAVVEMRRRVEEEKPPLVLPARRHVRVGRNLSVYPLDLPAGVGLLVVQADSPETLGLVLEAKDETSWRSVATAIGRPAQLEVPLDPGATLPKLRLRLWSADERGLPVDLRALAVPTKPVTESDLARGLTLKSVGLDLPLGAAEVVLDTPGTLRAEQPIRWSTAYQVMAREAAHGDLSSIGTRVWLFRDLPGASQTAELRAQRIRLESKKPLELDLGPGRPITLDVARPDRGPILVEARAQRAQVALAAHDGTRRRVLGALDVRPKAAVTLLVDESLDSPEVEIWAAEPTSDAFDVTLVSTTFDAPRPTPLAAGASAGGLAKGGAVAFELPVGQKRVRVALEPGLVAALTDGTKVRRLHWASGQEETLDTAPADKLLMILNPLGSEGHFAVELLQGGGVVAERTLSLDTPLEVLEPRAGARRLDVAASSGRTRLHVRGGTATFVGASGKVRFGEDLELDGESGAVRLTHAPGLVVAWLDTPEGKDGLFPATLPKSTGLSLPSSVPLSGNTTALSVEAPSDVMLHVATEVPVVARWTRPDAPARVEIFPGGALLDAYLPKGAAGQLVLRALGAGATLRGALEVTATEVTRISEGLGPEVVLTPGGTRLFAFELPRETSVGFGVQSDAPGAEAVLMNTKGERLGGGVIDMVALEKGTYLIGLRVPESAGPVRARPALAGLRPPPNTPPEEVVRAYIQAASGVTPGPVSTSRRSSRPLEVEETPAYAPPETGVVEPTAEEQPAEEQPAEEQPTESPATEEPTGEEQGE